MITGIIITHGNLAEAIVSTVEKIVGPVPSLIALSNEGLSLKDLTARVHEAIQNHVDEDGICIMVELRGGSCWMAAKQVSQNHAKIFIISGINIPMVLTFITMRDSVPLQELVNKIRESGVQNIIIENFLEAKSKV